jgi:hypothetical protein
MSYFRLELDEWDPQPMYLSTVNCLNKALRARHNIKGSDAVRVSTGGGAGGALEAGTQPSHSPNPTHPAQQLQLTESNVGKLQYMTARHRAMTMDSMRRELAASIVNRMRMQVRECKPWLSLLMHLTCRG